MSLVFLKLVVIFLLAANFFISQAQEADFTAPNQLLLDQRQTIPGATEGLINSDFRPDTLLWFFLVISLPLFLIINKALKKEEDKYQRGSYAFHQISRKSVKSRRRKGRRLIK